MTVGERIKQRRLALGKSADEVADLLGKNRATVYRYESNEIENLPAKVLAPLAKVLETSPAYLMGWTDDPYDYETDPNDLLSEIPTAWLSAWREEGLSNSEIWRRFNLVHDEGQQKSPDTLLDTEGMSESKRALYNYVMSLTDDEADKLRSYAEFVLSQRG